MAGVTHRFIETNGIRMHIAEQGSGPLVLLLHGFPELWYSWRHQLEALADAGYHAVAPDQRGYGQTDRPGSRQWSSGMIGARRWPGTPRSSGRTGPAV